MPHWQLDVSRLHFAIESIRRFERMSARELAAKVGIPASTLTRIKDGHRPDVDAFASLVMYLRLDPVQCFARTDGVPVERHNDYVSVDRRDVMMACSWAREALANLSEEKLPPRVRRERVMAAIARLYEEAGQEVEAGPTAEELQVPSQSSSATRRW